MKQATFERTMQLEEYLKWKEAVARCERKLAVLGGELAKSGDERRVAELNRCIEILDAMLSVYRQMDRLMSAIERHLR